MLSLNKIKVLWTKEQAGNGYWLDSQQCLPQTGLGRKYQEFWFGCGKFQSIWERLLIRLLDLQVWNSKERFELDAFFWKFSILFKMCWVAEDISDLGNCWEYTWESKRGTNNQEGFSEYIRIQFYNVETWLPSQPAYLRTAENEGGRKHMAQQLGTINRISPAAWELSYGERLIGKAWILPRDQCMHGNVKGVRPGLRFWTKESTRKLFHLRQWCSGKTGSARHGERRRMGRAGSRTRQTWFWPWDPAPSPL